MIFPAILIALFLKFYYFNLYEVSYSIRSYGSSVEIRALPLNAFGEEIPFRNLKLNHRLLEGVQSVRVQSSFDRLRLFPCSKAGGKVKVRLWTDYSLLPTDQIVMIK